jgi:hypothetical protein
MQRRMAKACIIADKAEEMGFTPDDFHTESVNVRKQWATLCGIKVPSKETWFLAADLLSKRESYDGPSGLEDPRFIQNLTKMAVNITETLDKNNLDSDEACVTQIRFCLAANFPHASFFLNFFYFISHFYLFCIMIRSQDT